MTDDPITRADLTREDTMFDVQPMSWEETAKRLMTEKIGLHDELERLRTENARLIALIPALRQAATDLRCCVTAFRKAQTDPPALAVPPHCRERDAEAMLKRAMDALYALDERNP